ncbi:hypothetical protein Esti_006813 [Eimeria stiedai]
MQLLAKRMSEGARLCAPKRGALLVFEGIDRSGKSSQATLLYERLLRDGVKAKLLRFPDRSTHIGRMINAVLSGNLQLPAQALHLLFAANRWEVQPQITKCLREGCVLLLDRYSFSGVAYSTTAANMLAEKVAGGGAPGGPPRVAPAPVPLTREFAMMTERGLPAPDRVFFLDVQPEEAKERGGFGDELYETLELQRRIYDAYTSFRGLPYWRVLPASGVTKEKLHETIVQQVADLFAVINTENQRHASRRLWEEA